MSVVGLVDRQVLEGAIHTERAVQLSRMGQSPESQHGRRRARIPVMCRCYSGHCTICIVSDDIL